MDAAKSAVNKIIGRSGQHTTEVHEEVNPAVTSETVKPHRHEETTQAVDREVHQDHYHTTVQPLQDKQVLPEQHTHQMMPVQERSFTHGDTEKVRGGVEAEAAKFQDTSMTAPTTTSASAAPTAAGEHVHHHVHERVQPVINRETVQPEVVHTTVPIHETHQAEAQHHGMSTLPTKTLAEFENMGGKIMGGGQRHEEYEGHPRPYNPEMQASRDVDPMASGLTGTTGTTGTHHGQHGNPGSMGSTGGVTGTTGTNVSGVGHGSTGVGYTDYSQGGVAGSTGTSLGGRAEGNTTSRALDAATSHGMGGYHASDAGTRGTSSVGSDGATTGRSLEHSTTGRDTTSGVDTQHRGDTDISTRSNQGNINDDTRREGHSSDTQHPSQGKDPSLMETNTKGGLKGEGVDGSHSAVFGLTPDGHKYDDTTHGSTKPVPAHGRDQRDNAAEGDTGSRAAVSGGVAEQMHDPRVAEKGHGGPSVSNTGSAKPGAGAPGGEQGFGQVAPEQHGGEAKAMNKLDPTTDADNDGKRGIGD